jgi:hypothetical protein
VVRVPPSGLGAIGDADVHVVEPPHAEA